MQNKHKDVKVSEQCTPEKQGDKRPNEIQIFNIHTIQRGNEIIFLKQLFLTELKIPQNGPFI